jgi:hypothetical protein
MQHLPRPEDLPPCLDPPRPISVTFIPATRRSDFPFIRPFDALAPGDVVTVTRIDRLARSTFDLFAIVKRIVDAKAQPLAEPLGRHRHRHQHRALDARGLGRPSRCRA